MIPNFSVNLWFCIISLIAKIITWFFMATKLTFLNNKHVKNLNILISSLCRQHLKKVGFMHFSMGQCIVILNPLSVIVLISFLISYVPNKISNLLAHNLSNAFVYLRIAMLLPSPKNRVFSLTSAMELLGLHIFVDIQNF